MDHPQPEPQDNQAYATTSTFQRRRRFHVQTNTKKQNIMNHVLHTRSLSEMVFSSPRDNVHRSRFDMDIEIGSAWAQSGGATLDWMSSGSTHMDEDLGESFEVEEDPEENNAPEAEEENQLDDVLRPATTLTTDRRDVSGVIDMLFEIHSALKSKHMGKRTAASALAASNLVSTTVTSAALTKKPASRDEQLATLENLSLMLTCAICQELVTEATEISCCGQTFCYGCVERWVHEKASCPMCRQENLTEGAFRRNRPVQRMADEILTRCAYCHVELKHGVISSHLKTCSDAPAPALPEGEAMQKLLLRHARASLANLRQYLQSPAPPSAQMMQCYIRNRNTRYELYTVDGDVLLAVAERRRHLNMTVTYHLYCDKASLLSIDPVSGSVLPASEIALTDVNAIGHVDRNFVGSQYTIFSTLTSETLESEVRHTDTELGAVQYAATYGKSPRQMRVAVPIVALEDLSSDERSNTHDNDADDSTMMIPRWNHVVPDVGPNEDPESRGMLHQIQNPDTARSMTLINKPPVWIESLEAYCLDFGGRVSSASVKNFLLANPGNMDQTMMLFGRTQDRNVYSMDYSHPLSALQAFSIALSSMDSHLVTFD